MGNKNSRKSKIQEYIELKDIIQNTTAIIRNGSSFRMLMDGTIMTEDDFRKTFRLPENPFGSKSNPDGTRILKN